MSRYFDRELSWLAFNERVLSIALDPAVPALERLKFCAIHASNLNEFFMVRVAGVERKHEDGHHDPNRAGLTPIELLEAIRKTVIDQERQLRSAVRRSILPRLARSGLHVVPFARLEPRLRAEASEAFFHDVLHLLTPTPFESNWVYPGIPTLALGLVVRLRDRDGQREWLAYVRVPTTSVPRFMPLSDGSTYVPVEDVIVGHLDTIFPTATVIEHALVRTYRDADVEYRDDTRDVRQAVGSELRFRRHGPVVRLDLSEGTSRFLAQQIRTVMHASPRHVYKLGGLLGLDQTMQLARIAGYDDLQVAAIEPRAHPRLGPGDTDIFAAIRAGDILVHHPYHSYADTVERFVAEAVRDPAVLAIKQTVYRTSDDSLIVPSLIAARNRERRAVCLVEIKARFDEIANLHWGRELEHAGVQVSYGLPGLKTHAKAILVVRKEADGIRRYVHIGTGNYHATTSRLYSDSGLLTCNPAVADDVADLFHWLTDGIPEPDFASLIVAPTCMRPRIVDYIDKVRCAALKGERARVLMKLNSLVDPELIEALYGASQAGARIDLNVRGICCLRPGVTGLSETIRVVSIVGRVLEHSRLFVFEHGDSQTLLLGSADLMPRNLDARVETLVDVKDAQVRAQTTRLLERYMSERTDAWQLRKTGNWVRRGRLPGRPARDLHDDLGALLSRSRGAKPVGAPPARV